MANGTAHALNDEAYKSIQQQIAELHGKINGIPRRVDGARVKSRLKALLEDHPLVAMLVVAAAAVALALVVAALLRRRR
jgi:hypothetical protein